MSRIVPSEPAPTRRPWLAVLLALVCPGAGHLYAGYPLRAVAAVFATAIFLIPAALWVWTLPLASGAGLRSLAALALLVLPAADAGQLASRRPAAPGSRRLASVLWLALPLLVALLLALDFTLVTFRWLAVMRLDRESMRPNLLPGDLVLVDVRPDALAGVTPGNLVVFEHPAQSGRLHVKRLVASEGQEVAVQRGELVLDGEARGRVERGDDPTSDEEELGTQRYTVRRGDEESPSFGPLRVPAGSFFALGDDRAVSRDSRVFGPVPISLLRGRPLRVLWSTDLVTKRRRWERIGHDPSSAPLP